MKQRMVNKLSIDDGFLLNEDNKLRGGFYTPLEIAEWLCSWAIRDGADKILEPSCGDGIFLWAAAKRLLGLDAKPKDIFTNLIGIELSHKEAQKCHSRLGSILPDQKNIIHCQDFFAWALENKNKRFNCAIGNPPFIRYQNFPEPHRKRATSLLTEIGLSSNKLMNIWVPFVAVTTSLLMPGGRLAFVLPAELLQVSYAASLRSFLADQFENINILAFNQMLFEGAQEEVVLFLGERNGADKSISKNCYIDLRELSDIQEMLSTDLNSVNYRRPKKTVNHDTEKWLKYFLTPLEISLMRALRKSSTVLELHNFAEVDVGVVTGRNEFFVLNENEIRSLKIVDYMIPLISRSGQLKGSIIEKHEYKSLAKEGQRVFLLYPAAKNNNGISVDLKAYILYGELNNFHKGYKCSVRDPWYIVPSVWIPDLFLFRQIYDFPRIVLNKIGATSTDTIHRIKCKINKDVFLSNFYTHLTAASSEIEGRSYGGGVLELEPTEAERLLMPGKMGSGLIPGEIDKLIRQGKLEDVLYENDKIILINNLGMSLRDCSILKKIWVKMRDRRRLRKKKKYEINHVGVSPYTAQHMMFP